MQVRKKDAVKNNASAVYIFSAVVTACVYLLGAAVLPVVFDNTQMHMNNRNVLLIASSSVISVLCGIVMATTAYLIGTGTENLKSVKYRALGQFIKKSMNGVLFFVLFSFIWAVLSGIISVGLYAALKNTVSYENCKLIISAAIALLTLFIAPPVLIEALALMLKKGSVKDRLKTGWLQCRTGYTRVLIKIILLFLIGLLIGAIGLILQGNILGKVIRTIISSIFGGISLTYLTAYIMERFKEEVQ